MSRSTGFAGKLWKRSGEWTRGASCSSVEWASARHARIHPGTGDWPVPRDDLTRRAIHSYLKPQGLVSVSAARGSFDDFTSGGVAADAKASKFTTGASTPPAKI